MLKLWGTSNPSKGAMLHLIKTMQKQRFSEEINYLKEPKGKKAPSLVVNSNLFIDKYGILRSDGRIGKIHEIEFEYDVLHPILLAKDHELTKLIIEDCHLKVQHLGIGATMNQVRLSGFWITRARQAIKNVISPCLFCKKINNLAFKYPKVTNLPKNRVNLVQPFRHVGVDYTGAIHIREGKKDQTMYLLLFTCLNIRSVHIELMPDLNVNSFVLAFIRFSNLYGIPTHLYSDNAKTFLAGGDILEQVVKSNQFLSKFSRYSIKHIKIPLYSAWVGSCWERLIRVVKSCLYKVVGRVFLNYYQMLTVISDITNAVNSRPLTYRCAENSSLEIITPNHFIKPYVNDSLRFHEEDGSMLTKKLPSRQLLVKTLSNRDQLLEHFRSIWFKEYLMNLRRECKYLHKVPFVNKVKVNDVVLVKGPPKVKRPFWHLGRILELFPGDDGKVRSVKLLRADGEIANHSLNHLFPLELSLSHDHTPLEPMAENLDLAELNLEFHDFESVEGSGVQSESDLRLDVNLEKQDGDTDLLPVDELDTQGVERYSTDTGDPEGETAEAGALYLNISPLELEIEGNHELASRGEFLNEIVVGESPEENHVMEQPVPFGSGSALVEHQSGRPRRTRTSRGRPLDREFIFY